MSKRSCDVATQTNSPHKVLKVDDNDVTKKVVDSSILSVWTDGAAKANGKAHARAGYGVFFGDNDVRNISGRVPSRYVQTNQSAELLAITVALESLVEEKEKRKIKLITDSQYAISGVTSWMKNWKRNGWKTGKKQPVLHQEFWRRIDAAIQTLNVTFQHVRGHTGDYGNEAADKLAVAGSMKEF